MVAENPARLAVRYPSRIPVDEGLELRLVAEGDEEEIFRATEANRAYLREWLPWVDATRSVEDTRAFVARSMDQVRVSDGFQCRILHEGQFAGMVGYLYHDWKNLRTEIGYWLREDLQGRGLMTRSAKALVDFAFINLGLHRVEIRAATDNRRSRAVPERLGFVQEGVLRDAAWLNDRFIDLVVYAKLREPTPSPEATRSL
jgi:ribosomal-protein-serine acetyltransferase